ncbi:MAG: fused MFS/spermidine synthase [Vicinamibacterales bacterium]
MSQWLLLVAYAGSGVAALIYEVSWTRLLTLQMGRGLVASSTVLAAYMGGLALGAWLAGHRANRLSPRAALHAYAAIEAAVALLAIALPFELDLLSPLFAAVYGDAGGAGFGAVRTGAALMLLVLPAMALGATFPLAIRALADSAPPASAPGRLYAVNTIGAAIGALLSGFVLLPNIGLTNTLLVGVGASACAVGAALVVARRSSDATPATSGDASAPRAATASPRHKRTKTTRAQNVTGQIAPVAKARVPLALMLSTFTGLASFIAEVGWTRVFAMLVGPSTYAFAATVATFIAGLAIGAVLGTFIASRTMQQAEVAAVIVGLAAIAAAWSGAAAGTWLPRSVAADFAAAPDISIVSHAISVAAIVLPLAIGLGATFPLTLAIAGGAAASPAVAGMVYAVNTVAAVAGSLLTGFVLVPALGLERTLAIVPVLLAVAAFATMLATPRALALRLAIAIPAAVALVATFTAPAWNRPLLASGAYKYASAVPQGLDIETALTAGTLLYYRDGGTATVSVKRLTGALSLAIDGKVDASTAGDMLTQKLLAHLPLLLHGDAKEVGIIGLGSGITLASALTHPVAHVDVIEIAREVVDASRLFAPDDAQPLNDPRVRLLVTDARSHFALAARTYDVVVSEPSNPWMAGVAALFTREFFESARRRLTADGVMCQWVNTYDISTSDLQSIVATFTSVFPDTTLWLAGDGDLMLIGSPTSMDPKVDRLAHLPDDPRIVADLRSVGVTSPFGLLSMLVGGRDTARRFGADAPIQTDDRLELEFSAPRALQTAERRQNVAHIRALATERDRPSIVNAAWGSAGGVELAERAAILRRAGAYEQAYSAAADALDLSPGDAVALDVMAVASAAIGRQADAMALLSRLVHAAPDAAAPRVVLSRLQMSTGNVDAALGVLREFLSRHPDDADTLEQLASIYADVGDDAQLAPVAAALARFPDRAGAHYYAATLAFMQGQMASALAQAHQALEVDPRHARAHNLVGAIKATTGDMAGARQAFEQSLSLDPQDPTTYQNLAQLEASQGNVTSAARLYAEALSLDPSSATAREALARLHGST